MSSLIEVGQVLSLRIYFNTSRVVSKDKHPYLVVKVDEELSVAEIAQLDSLTAEKRYKAAFESNKVIKNSNPVETVIDRDSFVQMDNKFTVDLFQGLVNYRRQTDKLSNVKLQTVLEAYEHYQETHVIDEAKIVHITESELVELNS